MIKQINPEIIFIQAEAHNLLGFFAEQLAQKVSFWFGGKIYKFPDGTAFSFTNHIVAREGRRGVRLEIIDNAVLNAGSSGTIQRVIATLDVESNKDIIGITTHKKRVVKIQQHSVERPFEQVMHEYQITQQAGHFSVKKPVLTEHKKHQVSLFVMQELSDQLLLDFLNKDCSAELLNVQQRIHLTSALLYALKTQVSDRNIIHMDIKPENIFINLTNKDAPKITIFDFGLSMDIQNKLKDFGGTPEYAAPEAFQNIKVTRRTDVYSLGCVLYLLWNNNNNLKLHESEILAINQFLAKMLEPERKQRYKLNDAIKDFEALSKPIIARIENQSPENRKRKNSFFAEENKSVENLSKKPKTLAKNTPLEDTYKAHLSCFF